MKKLLTLSAAALMTVSVAAYGWGSSSSSKAPTQAANKIAVVDYMEVFKDVPQGQGKLDQLKSDLKPKVAKLKTEQDKLTQQIQDLEKNAPTLSKSQRETQETDLNKQQQAFQDQVMQLREAEMQKEQDAAKLFEADMNKAITTVAQAGKYDAVFTKQAVPYSAPNLDVTNQVVDAMKKLN